MKISEKIRQWKEKFPDKAFFSFEFFPPKTEMGMMNLYDRFDRLAALNPLWIDVTWRSSQASGKKTTEICINCIKYHGLEPLMHLTCTNMKKEVIDSALEDCKANGICNILALRGDPPLHDEDYCASQDTFCHAVDLVKYIKKQHGDFFCVGVAGYPEGHLECNNKELDLQYLKEKVDAGADFVITQLFFDIAIYLDFIENAKKIGINVPIIPGIMPIQSFSGFKKMTTYCKTRVPSNMMAALEEISYDDQKVKDFGVDHGIVMCKELLKKGALGLHFYTLNLEVSVVRIIEGLHLVDFHQSNRLLPWRTLEGRMNETVRPIFWANRPKSYIHRTLQWDDFPNGRWGNQESPAFGEPFLSVCVDPENWSVINRRKMWGNSLESIDEVKRVFCQYLKSDSATLRLPWCSDRPGDETIIIQKQLLKLNLFGLLTINSQPSVNCALSTDPYFGWGPPGGFVYQKAYVEFFCSPEKFFYLEEKIKQDNELTYSAVNNASNFRSNSPQAVNAVTWGVFPGEEIKQPTVVDTESFMVWKDEAFDLWLVEWAAIYPEDTESHKIIQEIHDNWYLVNVVNNNYVTGDLFGKLVKYAQEAPFP